MTMPMKTYYDLRSKIRELYANDVNNNGDLCSSVLQIRDKNKCISAISVNIASYDISIQFDDTADSKKREKIIDKIESLIHNYILENKDKINYSSEEEKQSLMEMITSASYLCCDTYVIGNSVNFSL